MRRIDAACESYGARLVVRLTPISADESRCRDFSPLNLWAKELQAEIPGVFVPQPALLVYEPGLMWDTCHLNARGVAKYMPVVAKDLEAALKK